MGLVVGLRRVGLDQPQDRIVGEFGRIECQPLAVARQHPPRGPPHLGIAIDAEIVATARGGGRRGGG